MVLDLEWSSDAARSHLNPPPPSKHSPGENVEGGKGLRQQAGEIMACKLYGTVKSGAEYKTFFWKSNRFRLTFRFLFCRHEVQ